MNGFIDKIGLFVEKHVAPPLIKFSSIRYIVAIQNAFIALMPITIISSFFILGASLPFEFWQNFLTEHELTSFFWGANNSLLGFMALFLAFTIGYYLALWYKNKGYKMDPVVLGVITLGLFLVINPTGFSEEVGGYLPTLYMGSQGIFTAIICAIFTVEVYRFFIVKKIVITMPDSVPPMIADSFTSLIPATAIIMSGFALVVAGINISEIIFSFFEKFVVAADSMIAISASMFLDRILWFVGIHGSNIVGAIMGPFWETMQLENIESIEAGGEAVYIGTSIFLSALPRVSVSAICVACIVSGNSGLKKLGIIALIPAIFNIGEPILFGLPIVLNPLMFIPWVIGYTLLTAVNYIICALGLVVVPYIPVPWTTPGILLAYLSSGGAWSTTILHIIDWFIMFAIFYPFVKIYGKQLNAAAIASREEEGSGN